MTDDQREARVEEDLFGWFDNEGLIRYAAFGDPDGSVTEVARGPLVALGPRDEDYYLAPHPDRLGYTRKRLRDMTFEDYQTFMMAWFEHAVLAGDMRCANCDKVILATTDDMADTETWDAIFIEKDIVAWMLVHFDCKKQLPRHLKGRHPFELEVRLPPVYDLSGGLPAATGPAGEVVGADAEPERQDVGG